MNKNIISACQRIKTEHGLDIFNDSSRVGALLADLLKSENKGDRDLLVRILDMDITKNMLNGQNYSENELQVQAAYISEKFLYREDSVLASLKCWEQVLNRQTIPHPQLSVQSNFKSWGQVQNLQPLPSQPFIRTVTFQKDNFLYNNPVPMPKIRKWGIGIFFALFASLALVSYIFGPSLLITIQNFREKIRIEAMVKAQENARRQEEAFRQQELREQAIREQAQRAEQARREQARREQASREQAQRDEQARRKQAQLAQIQREEQARREQARREKAQRNAEVSKQIINTIPEVIRMFKRK